MTRSERPANRAPDTIETPRLTLIRPRATDAREMFARYASDADVTRYLGWPRHRSVADTEAYVKLASHEWDTGPVGAYLIRDRADGRLLGATGLSRTVPKQFLTGYVLATDAWGQGYATEALTAMVSVASQLRARRVYALCHVDHRSSQRVLEKCGFIRDPNWSKAMAFPNLDPTTPQATVCYARV
jgi:ribosomal-protein-alanine N-acetyltransferase